MGEEEPHVEVTNEEIWELINIAIDSLAFGDGQFFKLTRSARQKVSMAVCNRNLEQIPIRIRSRLVLRSPTKNEQNEA